MSLRGKIEHIQDIIHLIRINKKNREADFHFLGERLNHKVEIQCSKTGHCNIGQIWAGAGEVKLCVYGDGALSVEDNVCFNANVRVMCRKKIEIGENTMFGPNIVIIDHDHDYKSDNWKDQYKCSDIIIGKNVWIGANVTILRGTVIGDNCIIGAGTVVKGNYNSNSLYYSEQNVIEKQFVRSDD